MNNGTTLNGVPKKIGINFANEASFGLLAGKQNKFHTTKQR